MQNLVDLIKKRDFVIPSFLLENYREMKIEEFELIVIIYYINETNLSYNPQAVSKYLNVPVKKVMEAVANLQNKNVITIDIKDQNGIRAEYINLENLYNKMGFVFAEKEHPKEKETLFDQFEKEFGRTLSPIEFEIINAWKDQKIKEELIVEALKEAIFNGVRNLRYIDAILNDWTKRGYKKASDLKQDNKKPIVDKKLFEYDWLNEKE